MAAYVRCLVCHLMAFALAVGQVVPAGAAPLSKADYEACQARDEAALRTAIEGITLRALKTGTANVDYRAVVDDAWRRGHLDEIIDQQVDKAVEEVADETSWSNLLQSLAYQQKAQELATAVAERVYRSDAMKKALETLAVNVGQQVGKQMEFASQDAAQPTLSCLKAFVGARYGATAARAMAEDAGRTLTLDPDAATAEISPGAVLRESSGGITGAAVLIMRRQLANMARRVGQRIVGSVLARVVSVVAGGIGVALIAKDIWDLRRGVLPIIADEMKSKDSKDKVKEELAKTFEQQISSHMADISAATAARIIDVWRDFRSAHAAALDIAQRNPDFKAFLDSLKPQTLPRLDEIVSLVLAQEGEAGLLQRLKDGTLSEAVNRLPEPAMTIARDTRSVEAALKWNAVAGSDLPQVVALELHRRTTPDNLSRAGLKRLLALNDRLATVRLASLDRSARDTLFELGNDDLKSLARGLTEGELTTLSGYLTGLEQGPRERILRAVAADPAKMQALATERVRSAVVASADQSAAVDMMLRVNTALDPSAIVEDVRLAAEGRIRPILVWEKHPIAVVGAGVLMLLVLLLLRRLLFPRRPGSAPA